jgi:hypothetical protein
MLNGKRYRRRDRVSFSLLVVAGIALFSPCGCGTKKPPHESQTFHGLYAYGNELVSNFVTNGEGCPGEGKGYWINPTEEFWKHMDAAIPELTREYYRGMWPPIVFRVTLKGFLSPPGHYGHMGECRRMLTVVTVLEMTRIDPCEPAELSINDESLRMNPQKDPEQDIECWYGVPRPKSPLEIETERKREIFVPLPAEPDTHELEANPRRDIFPGPLIPPPHHSATGEE